MLTAYNLQLTAYGSTPLVPTLENRVVQSLRYEIGIENDKTTSPSRMLKSPTGGGNPLSVFFPVSNQFRCDEDIWKPCSF